MPEPTVHPRALPSDLGDDDLLVRPAVGAHLAFGPEQAEWRYLSYVVHPVETGHHLVPAAADHEACVLIQSGHDVTISDGEEKPIKIEIVMNNSAGLYQVDGLLKAKLQGSGLEPYVEVIAHIDTEAEKRLVPIYRLET